MVALTPETGNRNNKAYKLLRTAVDAAVDAGILETNPVVIKASHRRTAPLKHRQATVMFRYSKNTEAWLSSTWQNTLNPVPRLW